MASKPLLLPEQCFFTTDHHFGHANIIRFSNRPFKDVTEMDETMIQRWNEVVPEDGIVFNLGDFSFHGSQRTKEILDQLNGTQIWVLGNHRGTDEKMKHPKIKSKHELLEICVADRDARQTNEVQYITLCHYGMRTWNQAHRGAWHLFGHSHGGLKDDNGCLFSLRTNNLSLDCGVDSHDFRPLSYSDVKTIMGGRIFSPVDHHSQTMVFPNDGIKATI